MADTCKYCGGPLEYNNPGTYTSNGQCAVCHSFDNPEDHHRFINEDAEQEEIMLNARLSMEAYARKHANDTD